MATARWVSPAYSLACRNVDTPVCEPVFRPMPGACMPRKDTGHHTPGQRATIVEFRTALVNYIVVRASSRRACEISNHDARLPAQVALLPDGLPASGIEISMPPACFKSQCLARLEQSGNTFRASRRRSRPVRAPKMGARVLIAGCASLGLSRCRGQRLGKRTLNAELTPGPLVPYLPPFWVRGRWDA
jgi:hypothetical protein